MLYNTKNPHGGDIYGGGVELDFSANINPFGTPEGVKAAVCACAGELFRYPDPYCRKLVSAIAEHECVPKEYVLCGGGAAELIYAFCAAVKPKRVVEPAPTFAEYSLPLSGARIERFFLREEEEFALSGAFLGFVEAAAPDAVFLCDPNNPTGRAAEPELVLKLAELCKRLGARLFLDECFMDLSSKGASFVPRLSSFPNTLVLKAFTKSYGLAGVRLGYALGADPALLYEMARAVQPWNVSSVAQAAGLAALKETGFLEKTRALIENERPALASGLREAGCRVFDSDVNFLLFKGPGGLEARLEERGIKLRNCGNFHGLTNEFHRAAVKLPAENRRLVEAVKECMKWQRT